LGGRIELRGDTFLLRHGRGERNGEPLPAMNARISGFSNFLRAETTQAEPDAIAPDFSGLDALIEILEELAPDENESEPVAASQEEASGHPALAGEEERTPAAWDVRIEHLEHPSLPWVVRNGDFSIVRSSDSTKIQIASMLWGGIPSRGSMISTTSPSSRIQLVLHARPPTPGDDEKAGAATPVSEPSPGGEALKPVETLPWVSGRVKISWLETGLIPLEGLTTDFAVQGNSLYLTSFHAGLEAGGKLTGDMEMRLGRPGAVRVALVFSIEDASLSRVAEIFGVPAGDITGSLRLGGSLAGDLRPGQPLFADLEGRVDLGARKGELQRKTLPILLALAQASEGYNEEAERASIAYESMTADMTLADGRVVTRNFELEGPLRIYASGTLDIADPPYEIIGVAGLFLFRGAGQLLEAIPLVKIILPGSEKGLVGTYYQVSGHLSEPTVRALPGRSFAEGLPDALEAPYQILRAILSGGQIDEGRTGPDSP
ncbi:MAG: AsmA-like C-terminal region-containing protein, partial [Myxococcota bacterium]|nr:AsmA-like C-terminal region-containing protein [Myxococcota bacterium]